MGVPQSYGAAIVARIDELARLSSERGNLTRLYLSAAHDHAAHRVMTWMENAGMTARIDAIGNVAGRYEAEAPDAPALLIGSHIDTVRDAGRFDGNLGVVAGIEIVRRLHDAGTRLPIALEVVAFGDEEGVRFPTALGGSRALAGIFDPAILDEKDLAGVTRRQALIDFGCNPTAIKQEARDPSTLLGYIEMHIEQGPVLEAERLPVGVVTAINGVTRGTVTIMGRSAHAGTVPMGLRHDALAAAAEMILSIERQAKGVPDLVATVGRLDVANGAVNTVPGRVSFTLDIRSPADVARKAAVAETVHQIAAIAAVRHVEASVHLPYDAPATVSDPELSKRLATAISGLGLSVRNLPSGAGHDAMAFRGIVPVAMLFVRCRGGVSHNPAEFASEADIDVAAQVLERFVVGLSSQTK